MVHWKAATMHNNPQSYFEHIKPDYFSMYGHLVGDYFFQKIIEKYQINTDDY
jgi:hypothetical protein